MTSVILAREATVKTAAVEVKALTISGKQVTLAVFRQLEERELVNEYDASLNGMPWGWVNYHPDKCADDMRHIHVVWQQEDRLYRARVEPDAQETAGFRKRKAEQGSYAAYVMAALCLEEREPPKGLTFASNGDVEAWLPAPFGLVRGHIPGGWYALEGFPPGERREGARARVRDWLETACADLAVEATAEAIATKMRANDEETKQFLADWKQRFDELASLDQLFIAV
jgi:hypothetical protein